MSILAAGVEVVETHALESLLELAAPEVAGQDQQILPLME
jgi:hypothetical protein